MPHPLPNTNGKDESTEDPFLIAANTPLRKGELRQLIDEKRSVRVPFSDVKARVGGGPVIRGVVDVVSRILESAGESPQRITAQITGGTKLPGPITTQPFFSSETRTVDEFRPLIQEAQDRAAQLDKKRNVSPFLNTLQATAETIFLPILDTVDLFGVTRIARQATLTPKVRNALRVLGASEDITEEGIRKAASTKFVANTRALERGKITEEVFTRRQDTIGKALDIVTDEKGTRFGKLGQQINEVATALEKERSLKPRGTQAIQLGARSTDVLPPVQKVVVDDPKLQKFADEVSDSLSKSPEELKKEVAQQGDVPVRQVAKTPDVVPIAKELEPLAKEAQKFKTAEEFIESQGKVLFHGGAPFDEKLITKDGISLTDSEVRAKLFSEGGMGGEFDGKNGVVNELVLDSKAKIMSTEDIPKRFIDSEGHMQDVPELIEFANKKGFDGVDLGRFGESEVRVFNPAVIKTKSQLTDFFNKVKGSETPPTKPKEPTTTPKSTPTEPPKKGVSKHFERIKHDLEAAHDSVEFEKINLKDQAEQAFKFIEESPSDAMKVAYGNKNPPGTLTKPSVQIALIESLKSAGKLDQARALARRLSLEFTKSAQQLNIAKIDLGPAGVRRIEAIIMEARLKKIGKKLGKVFDGESAVKRAHRKIKSDARAASQAVQKEAKTIYKTADDLLDALTC